MAIEIIPGQEAKRQKKLTIIDAFYYLAIVIALAVVAGYIALIFLFNSSEERLEEIKTAIAQKETVEIKMLEKNLLLQKKIIDTFADLFAKHKKTTNLFNFVKAVCHKELFFTNIELKTEESRLGIGGTTDSLGQLAEQVSIFENEGIVKKVDLLRVGRDMEGRIIFELEVSLDPAVFK